MNQTPPAAGSRARLVVLAVIVLVAAFLGVMAGNAYLEWRSNRAMAERVEQAKSGQASRLHPGDLLPDVPVVAIDGMATGMQAFARDGDLIVLFIATDCEPCAEAVAVWNRETPESGTPRVVGVCANDVDYARVYAQKSGFRFPLLCDTAAVFAEEYAMDIIPSVIGVRRGGRIAYIRHGIGQGFTLSDAITALREAP
ncbi:MAG TPA: redoxin domain-containing protein [bacterium]|nr:redoxin domain-containing protein [bacterium]